ncbi:MAG: ChaN family lipoprotein [Bacteroidales bacterium]|nr:ChaN family lipoprotein [Bacteroidales bacterium]
MKSSIILLLLAAFLTSMKGDLPAYRIFEKEGKKTSFKDMTDDAFKADVVLFGELHNNPISHWLQLELTRALADGKGDRLLLGAEMFESDDQLLLDEYTGNRIATRNFEEEAKLWNNYSTDYKPLVELARERQLRFIATNIPRRYAAVVHRKGFEGLDSLAAEARELIAPLPVKYDPALGCYKSMMEMSGDMGGMGGYVSPNLPKAQAIKDATMAHFILKNLQPGETLIHFNGAYHSDHFEGIAWYLLQEKPDMNILTITTVEQDTLDELHSDHNGLAHYIICVPETMTKTY